MHLFSLVLEGYWAAVRCISGIGFRLSSKFTLKILLKLSTRAISLNTQQVVLSQYAPFPGSLGLRRTRIPVGR